MCNLIPTTCTFLLVLLFFTLSQTIIVTVTTRRRVMLNTIMILFQLYLLFSGIVFYQQPVTVEKSTNHSASIDKEEEKLNNLHGAF